MKKTATITLVLIVVGFIIWRNYGVIAVGERIELNDRTNEQKELKRAVNKIGTINKGLIIKTSFGFYEYTDMGWVKTKEIWDAKKIV